MKFEETNDTIYCRFEGSINTTVCTNAGPVLADRINAAWIQNHGMSVVFDMKDAHYICSDFLRLCVLYSRKVGKERFRVENASEEIRNVFNIVGLPNMLF
jgi:hypothetical protein